MSRLLVATASQIPVTRVLGAAIRRGVFAAHATDLPRVACVSVALALGSPLLFTKSSLSAARSVCCGFL